eukprot:TRINITY_DN66973_c6_g3_i1.p1 TRINITY_DN66973_c6_g3~~TRINITY_DN66973_c6_g3_i1.p1  ORF type:complete len:953 (+),score=542.04 TRINITY_DN66973_c6_g3_i1:83-2860(+)
MTGGANKDKAEAKATPPCQPTAQTETELSHLRKQFQGITDSQRRMLETHDGQRYWDALQHLPARLRKHSSWMATKRLFKTGAFCVMAIHALSISPAWALPICWVFAAIAFGFLFDVGHDCSSNNFFESQTANNLVGLISLMPLLQPAALWVQGTRDRVTKSTYSWFSLLSWPRSMAGKGLTASHVLVGVFSAIFFPYMIKTGGVWGLFKYWGIPFALFNIWMYTLVRAGTNLSANLQSYLPQGIAIDLGLRSYLRFNLNVPSYWASDAVDATKRMWRRVFLDREDALNVGDAKVPTMADVDNNSSNNNNDKDEEDEEDKKNKKSKKGGKKKNKQKRSEKRKAKKLANKANSPSTTDDDDDEQDREEEEEEQERQPGCFKKRRKRSSSKSKRNLIDGLHNAPAWQSFFRGFRQLDVLGRGLSVVLKLLAFSWLYLLWNSSHPLIESMHHGLNRLMGVRTVSDATAAVYDTASAASAAAASARATAAAAAAAATAAASQQGMWYSMLHKTMQGLLFQSPEIVVNIVLVTLAIALVMLVMKLTAKPNVYLVDFVTYTAAPELRVTTEKFKAIQRQFDFNERSLEFMDRLIHRTGLGEHTYFPPGTLTNPPQLTLSMARLEAELVMFSTLDQLFATTNTHPRDVDILVVNCSLFNPTPSLTAMVVNKYKMREDIQSYNLSGMGCSAGVIAVHLAKDLLRVHPNSTAVVISTENITQNWYRGQERGMLISNTLFRLGGAAVLMSNKPSDRARSKYRLKHTVRTHRGADDESYYSVYQDTDEENNVGVRLSKGLMRVAGEALKRNITTLGPLVLPWSEQIKYFYYNMFQRKLLKRKMKPYVPNFRAGIQHFCIHAGGRAVIEAIEEALRLTPEDIAASKATLKRYGNTSSSSIWYELAYMEKHGLVQRNHRVWQIAFGSGFKCNSAVWEAL